jgi:quercetin dioxygenase-like cupin family protein
MADMRSDLHPTEIRGFVGGALALPSGTTHFGFVHEGRPRLESAAGAFELCAGMYFSVPDQAQLTGRGRAVVMSRSGYTGTFSLGGPIEPKGRLRYIDGCSDSLVIAPVVRGDPCFNMVYVPPNIDQTAHTHPSHRIGFIVDGFIRCDTELGSIEFRAGQAFFLPRGAIHSFHTRSEPVRIMAYHPDSEFGPSHEEHPILNRTLVDGVDAARIAAIRTQAVS